MDDCRMGDNDVALERESEKTAVPHESGIGTKWTFVCNCNSATGRYSLLVRRKETNRIVGAASTTTGSIVTHEMTQDNSQCVMNWVIVTTGKLAIPAAIRHVSPA